MKIKLSILCLLVIGLTNTVAQTNKKPAAKAKPAAKVVTEGIFAEIETVKGKIEVQLEYKKTPITVASFVSLAEGTNTNVTDPNLKGKPFYNGLKFHRVITKFNGDTQDFMIQGGDPQGNGSGGPGYAFKDEINSDVFDKEGILAMANSGPNTNGSQFFITVDPAMFLNGGYTIFGHVTKGQNVVESIKKDDVIKKVTIIRIGSEAKKFDAPKVFADYMANKSTEDAKQAAIAAENKKRLAEAEAKRLADLKAQYAPVYAAKAKSLNEAKAIATETASGLRYKIIQKGTDKKPADGTTVYIHYAGYLEDGTLFDSSYELVCKEFGKFDENRAKQNGYQPFPFAYGKKEGLIPGFLEGLSLMNFGDKMLVYIPSKLGYGERGAGNVIPPNSNIIFEIEMLETPPVKQ